MSEDPDFDMDIVEDDELDELGTDDSSLSERRTRTGKKEPVEKADESLDSRSESVGSREEEHTGSSSEKRHTDSDAGARGDNYITGFGSFPSDWEKKGIAECAEIRDSERIPLNSSEREEIQPGNIPYYGANGIVDYVDDYLFDSELILLAEDGGHFEEYEKRPVAYRVSGKAWINNHAHILEAKEGINTEYLFYGLEHRNLVPYVSGSTRSKLTQSMLRKVRVPLPPLPEQRKIASVLYAVDQAIQKTEEVIEQHRTFRQALINHLFSEGLSTHPEILDRDDLKILEGGISTDMDRTSVGRSPSSWKRVRLSEVTSESSYGVAESAQDFDPHLLRYVRITDISADGRLKDEDPASLPADAIDQKYLLSAGDLLFARSGATVGKTLLYRDHHPKSVYAGYLIRFVPDTRKVLPEYLFYYTQTRSYQKWVTRVTRKGAQENINAQEYGSILLPLPPLEEQEAIIEVLEQERKAISEEIAQEKQLKRMKIGLMQDLLTGEVRTVDKAIETLDEVKAHE